MSNNFAPKSIKRKNAKNLALNVSQPPAAPTPSAGDAQIPGSIGNSRDRSDTLEIGVEFRLDLHNEDLVVLKSLGAGNGGTVTKVQHKATRAVMARKIIHVEANKEIRRRIVRELNIMHECNSPHIISFYGAFMGETGDVVMCMEYMDCGSLDSISKSFGPIRIDVLGKIAVAVLGGLTYLYDVHHIMHRDIKPSNVLINSKGEIKICDFGVSGELENSVADTFVGTGTYMAPERIQGEPYTVKSDVWSVGLTLMELAIGKFPFLSDDDEGEDGAPQGILDLLQTIVLEPSPKLPKSDAFPAILDEMIDKCLVKDPKQRPTPRQLYDNDAFLQAAKRTPVDLAAWAVDLMEQHNRRSHLVELSPADKEMLRSAGNRSSSSSANATPTSAEIPIGNLSISGGNRDSARPFPQRTTSATRLSQQANGASYPGRSQTPQASQPQVPPKSNGPVGYGTGGAGGRFF